MFGAYDVINVLAQLFLARLCEIVISMPLYWLLVRATYVVDGRFLGHFFEMEGSSAHACESCTAPAHSN